MMEIAGRALVAVSRVRGSILGLLLVGALSITAAPALAATTIGETFDPTSGGVCQPADVTSVQTRPAQYVMLTAGVITSWSHRTADSPAQLKLKVGRDQGSDHFLIVGESALETPAANTLSTYPARISVAAGDVLGLYVATEGQCSRSADSTYQYSESPGDSDVGTAPPFGGILIGVQFDISAVLETDADSDGFGDETQDGCRTDPLRHDDCVFPNTAMTKDAPKRSTRHKIKFKFKADEPGSTFECKLDKKPFKPCTSPKTVRVGKGKHKFSVRAVDAAGNADQTPIKDKFKVVGRQGR